ncbi:MAG: hypothetical protein K2I42_06345 [Anaeroplasmataceae bacterium]|nr:hypothetical protein [Anaeroplasmataceae bacterium]
MRKHTCDLKDTIEYKMLCRAYYPLICIISIISICFLGVNISNFLTLSLDISILVFIVLLVFWIIILVLPTYILFSQFKEQKNLSIYYDSYEEMEVLLSIPIKVRVSAVKYVIKVKMANGTEKQVESHVYAESLITSNKMLIGYNFATNDIIFLKNI